MRRRKSALHCGGTPGTRKVLAGLTLATRPDIILKVGEIDIDIGPSLGARFEPTRGSITA